MHKTVETTRVTDGGTLEPSLQGKAQKRLVVRWLNWLWKHLEQIVIVIIGFLIVALIAAFLGVMFYESIASAFQEWIGIKESKNPKKEVLEFLGLGISGVIALFGLVALNRRASAQVEQNKITETGHFQERLKAAVDHLSNKSASGRIASFYEFLYLAKDRKEYYGQSILDILCAHLRQITDYKDIPDNEIKHSEEVNTLFDILFRREIGEIFDGLKFDLQRVNLTGFPFSTTRIPKGEFDFSDAKLNKIFWMSPNLRKAKLNYTKLQGAYLHYADLQGAALCHADLQGAELYLAKLQNAKLLFAKLQRANLISANLRGADLQDADFQDADLREADLQGASLHRAINLGGVNLSLAKYNDETMFPSEFNPKSKGMKHIRPR